MKKLVAIVLLTMLIFSSCGKKQDPAPIMNSGSITAFSKALENISNETLDMHRKLAQWYNLNLRSGNPEPGFERSYNSILFFERGIMGYVEIPKLSLRMSIYHGTSKDGFSHDPNSAFPVGGAENHTILRCEVPLELEEGDIILIHILNETLSYSIGEPGEDRCTLVCGEQRYSAGRMMED